MLRFLIRLVVLVVVVFAVLIGGLFLLPGDRMARIAGDQISAVLGREVELSGAVRPQLWPDLGVRTGAFSVAGFEAGDPLVSGQGLSVAVDLQDLIAGQVTVREVTLVSPVVTVETNAGGQGNWEFGGADEAGDQTSSTPELTIDRFSIQNGTLRYRDGSTRYELEQIDLAASLPEVNGPLSTNFDARMQGQRITGAAQINSMLAVMAGEPVTVALEANIGSNAMSYNGVATADGRLQGAVTANLPTPSALAQLVGTNLDLPAEVVPLAVAGQLDLSPDQVSLSDSRVTAGANTLRGAVSATLGDVPFVRGNLSAQSLDLAFLSADEGSAAPAAGFGWSREAIDASAVGMLNADVSIRAGAVDLGATQLSNAELSLTIDNRRAVAEILQARAFGGALTGRFVVNNRNGLSVGGAMEGRTVAIQALLTDIAGFERMRGVGDAQVQFLGVGQSLDAIMRSLSGEGRLTVGAGEITGFDLARLFSGADAVGSGATTIFDALGASFVIQNGVMRNSDLVVDAQVFEAAGEGQIDLGAQTLDYLISPRLEVDGQGITIPVRLRGPWASPRIYPDLEYAAEQRLKLEQDKLEAQARERLKKEEEKARARLKAEEEKLRARLEAEKQKAEDRLKAEQKKLEDRLKNEAEKALGNALGGLLGGN